MTEQLISTFVTLLVVIDPIGMGPVFLGLTAGLDETTRRKVALEASIIAFCVLAGTALVGDWLLAKLTISLAAFRIAGGLLLFASPLRWFSSAGPNARPGSLPAPPPRLSRLPFP